VLLGQYVRDNKIDSKEKLDSAIAYLKTIANLHSVDSKIFDEKAGVGVVTTDDVVEKAVKE